MTNHETPARDALMQAHVALAAQAGRDQADLARLRAVVARLTQMTDHWERQLPEVIRTPAVVSAIRTALEPAASVPPPATRADTLRWAAEAQQPDDGEGDELVCVDECGCCDACGFEPFDTPAEGWREAARFLRRTARDSGDRRGVLHGARLIEAELRRLADESGPCVAGEQQNETPEAEVVHGCPPDGSGLTPCCGRTPFELPLTDRISSEAPVTCPGKETDRG